MGQKRAFKEGVRMPTHQPRSRREARGRRELFTAPHDQADIRGLYRHSVVNLFASPELAADAPGLTGSIDYPLIYRREVTWAIKRLGQEVLDLRLNGIANNPELARSVVFFADRAVSDRTREGLGIVKLVPTQEVAEQMQPELDALAGALELDTTLHPLEMIIGRFTSEAAAIRACDVADAYISHVTPEVVTLGPLAR